MTEISAVNLACNGTDYTVAADLFVKQPEQRQSNEALSPLVLAAYRELATRNAIVQYDLTVQPIGGPGENSYGSVLKVRLTPTGYRARPLHTILKIAPTSPARRAHMRVKDVYAREVFMYTQVFSEFAALRPANHNAAAVARSHFTVAPQMLYSSLVDSAEFIIFEDLSETAGFVINSRINLPTYDLVVCAFRAIAQLHAMSFVLQARQPRQFAAMVAHMDDNLFTADMAIVSLQFGKMHVRLTRRMLEADLQESGEDTSTTSEVLRVLHKIENNFHEICLDAVNGAAHAPYAVVCHGDFWNNNILYEFDHSNQRAIKAKLIDFQISRYSPPVLDLVHYLFACTEKPLRDAHFHNFMQIYYDTLAQIICDYQLNPAVLYPERVFRQQLRQFGGYGFCMSAFSVPFFVSNASELPDLDKVSEAIQELSSASDSSDTEQTNDDNEQNNSDIEQNNNNNNNNEKDADAKLHKTQCAAELVEEFGLLTERTLPIFKRRMIGNVYDLQKYEMIEEIMKY